MNLEFAIAYRYLVGKKSTNAINIIVWISIIGMTIGTAALILILSVFNGFETLLAGLLNSFNPDLRVELREGKFYPADSIPSLKIKQIEGVEHMSFTLEETSFFEYKGTQEVGLLKGVDPDYVKVTHIDSTLIMGNIKLNKNPENITYGILGSGMNSKLSVNHEDVLSPVIAYMPAKKEGSSVLSDLNSLPLYPSGVFSVGNEVDGQLIIIPREAMSGLLELKNHFSAIEIKLKNKSFEKEVKSSLNSLLGNNFIIRNRMEQDDGFFKIMNIEKLVSFLIACLTFLLIALNLVGSLWMIVLEKKQDISILKSMGLLNSSIKKIFIYIGLYISVAGLILGMFFAFSFYFVQKSYGIIALPDVFIIDSYPIELRWMDFFVVSCTVVGIGYLASLVPAIRAVKVSAFVKYE
ncbi:MAG: ABC transporter permease [Saprospiraceae bacterium]|nr:ABC transporter permease [Saprospiraceae bacterium]MBK6564893.1 ABC transporter permease [Saprospiraceae bacterium]MBK7523538.1 ABC transporter permease [Saprospiraceae bacterium]MBK8371477.1 ABC transporter permease [Saprospiraceae bacterium]MBK8548740.1 ABC transporter permease [Saprospiraceae bacterium]